MTIKVRFMTTKTGRVHVVTTPGADKKNSKCGVVKANHRMPVASGGWGRKAGISPEAALAMLDCAKCNSHDAATLAIEAAKTPAQKRAERKRLADETRAKLGARNKTKKQPATKKAATTRRPRQGLDQMDAMKEKAQAHFEVAKDNGWKGTLAVEGAEVKVDVTKGKETLWIYYADGRIAQARVALSDGTVVRLRNSANWLRYAKGEMKVKGSLVSRRSGKRKAKDEAEEMERTQTPRKLPFDVIDDDDDIIIKALGGLMITWRNSISGNLDTARVPSRSRNVRISTHPSTGKRMISFHELQGEGEHGEVLGGERTVYLEKIIRAKA